MIDGRSVLLTALLLVVPAALPSVPTPTRESGPANASRSVWDGVYTPAQAKRGEEQYETFCSSCHGSDLQGDGADAAALAGPRFTTKWDGRTLGALFTVATQTMPQDAPGTLSPQAYGDLLAYILQANGFPDGEMELAHDADTLRRIVLEQTAPSPR
jgi:mono/diheme cytochrome c family protein